MAQLGFDYMRLPLLDMNKRKSVDLALLNQLVDDFIRWGNSYFDTAY